MCTLLAMMSRLETIRKASSWDRIERPRAGIEPAHSRVKLPPAVEAGLHPTQACYGKAQLAPSALQQDEEPSTDDECSADLDWLSISDDSEYTTAQSNLTGDGDVQRALELTWELFKHSRQCQSEQSEAAKGQAVDGQDTVGSSRPSLSGTKQRRGKDTASESCSPKALHTKKRKNCTQPEKVLACPFWKRTRGGMVALH
jgi:hypothetical protein